MTDEAATPAQSQDHGEAEGKRVLRQGVAAAGLRKSELGALPKGD